MKSKLLFVFFAACTAAGAVPQTEKVTETRDVPSPAAPVMTTPPSDGETSVTPPPTEDPPVETPVEAPGETPSNMEPVDGNPPMQPKHERRGVWVYSPWNWLGQEASVKKFEDYVDKWGISEVYLSTTSSLLSSSTLAPFIKRMTAKGVIVEALMGQPSWGTSSGRSGMLNLIDSVKRYNAAQPVVSRYSAIHLDVEPWIGTGSDVSWVDPLITSYKAAKDRVSGTGMAVSADMAGSKVSGLTLHQKQDMVDTLDRMTLMQYEITVTTVISRTKKFEDGLSLSPGQGVIIAMRAIDFPSNYYSVTQQAQDALDGTPGYLGWAHYHYDVLP